MKEGTLSKQLHTQRINQIRPYIRGQVLDIGCGSSPDPYNPNISFYTGIEKEMALIKKLQKKHPLVYFRQWDIDKGPLQLKHKYDIIMITAVLEHITMDAALLGWCREHLRNDASQIIITTPSLPGMTIHYIGAKIGLFSKEAAEQHTKVYTIQGLREIARLNHLEIVRYKTFQYGLNQLIVLKRKVGK